MYTLIAQSTSRTIVCSSLVWGFCHAVHGLSCGSSWCCRCWSVVSFAWVIGRCGLMKCNENDLDQLRRTVTHTQCYNNEATNSSYRWDYGATYYLGSGSICVLCGGGRRCCMISGLIRLSSLGCSRGVCSRLARLNICGLRRLLSVCSSRLGTGNKGCTVLKGVARGQNTSGVKVLLKYEYKTQAHQTKPSSNTQNYLSKYKSLTVRVLRSAMRKSKIIICGHFLNKNGVSLVLNW